jgi:uncharacterized protein YutE (UPF0331/DUF86 family)
VDRYELEARLRRIVESVQALRRKQGLPYETFTGERDTRLAAERDLQIAIEAAMEVGADLVSKHFPKVPATNRQIFRYMGECGILPLEFAERLGPMAGMRNFLVHVYLEVDPRTVYAVLQGNLDDLEEYVVLVSAFIEQHEID